MPKLNPENWKNQTLTFHVSENFKPLTAGTKFNLLAVACSAAPVSKQDLMAAYPDDFTSVKAFDQMINQVVKKGHGFEIVKTDADSDYWLLHYIAPEGYNVETDALDPSALTEKRQAERKMVKEIAAKLPLDALKAFAAEHGITLDEAPTE
jgi:hypothetical protein